MRFTYIVPVLLALTFHAVGAQQCLPDNDRVDCHPDINATEASCIQRGCTWCIPSTVDGLARGTPHCFTPPDYGYKIAGNIEETPIGYRVHLERNSLSSSYFGNDFNEVDVDVEFWQNHHLRIKMYPSNTPRYEVPLKLQVEKPTVAPEAPLYTVEFHDDPVFSFKVIRKSSNVVIFDTSLGGLTFSDQFIQISTKLPSTNAYGIGENEQHSFRHEFDSYHNFPLWARDQSPNGNANSYGVHPYYTVVENDGNAHSVMFLNSNAQEFVVTPAPGYVYRTIGGILDLHFFLGPTPEATVQQYTHVVGRAPIPPYWGLGFQLCRWGYNSLENMQAAVDRTAMYGIPHDVQYGDIDIMDRSLDFTVDPVNFAGLPEYVRELKAKGIKFITILDPGISFNQTQGTYRPLDLGNEMDVWIKRPDGTPMVGSVWPGLVYFPDYSKNATREWWITLITEFKNLLDFDGLWIDMNEPASWGVGDLLEGCMENNINQPPYLASIRGENLADLTVCPDVAQEYGIHYNTHSLYGWSESEPTLAGVRAALGKRGVVLTRSSFLGVGKWAAHWLGDNFSLWTNLHYSIIGMLQFNHFGVPYVGSDICGFGMQASKEMCQRWQELGAFYSFSRNHNALGQPDQDPGVWGEDVAISTRNALLVRYTLLPYLYTLFYVHATEGSTVVRALWHEFPTDPVALGVDRQFLWGSGLLVTPVLDEGQTSVTGYFPDARWYSYYDGAEVATRGDHVTLDAPLDFINVHVRGGIIYPTQEPAINTELARLNPYGLIIAYDDAGSAKGQLYLDDGDSIEPQLSGEYYTMHFAANEAGCTGIVTHNGFSVGTKTFGTIRVLGGQPITSILVDGVAHTEFTNEPSGEVKIYNLTIRLDQDFFIQFNRQTV